MRKKIIIPAATTLLALVISSCAPTTPIGRIKKTPSVYEQLSPTDQELAKSGKIADGMEKNAVLIALGQPSKVRAGSKDGVAFEKWYYVTYQPVYNSSVSFGLGYGGYGRRGFSRFRHGGFGSFGHGRYGHGRFGGFGLGHGISSARTISAVVEFDSTGRVKNWSQNQ